MKYKDGLHYGAVHLYSLVEHLRTYCNEEEQEVAFASIQESPYLAHPENVLLAMCGRFRNRSFVNLDM